jgi:AcrR family transcriptional regulator
VDVADGVLAEAGVAVRTIYSAFGAKREILSLICEQWLERALARERAAEVVAEPDPARRLRGAAGWLRALYAAGFDVVMIFEAATDESALAAPGVYRELVEESSWTPEEFERWVGDALERHATGDQAAEP